MREEIMEINPSVQAICDEVQVTGQNAAALFADDPIVCEAFDAAEARRRRSLPRRLIALRRLWSPHLAWQESPTPTKL